jgi:hypothetical protein
MALRTAALLSAWRHRDDVVLEAFVKEYAALDISDSARRR